MSRRDKARARAKEILRRQPKADNHGHLDLLRQMIAADQEQQRPDMERVMAARAETPIFAEVVQQVGIFPAPPWAASTALLPLVGA